MNCHEARPLMHDLLDRDLEASSRRALEEHLALCELCDRHYDELLAVERWANDLEPVAPAPDFTERVMARVVEEGQPAGAAATAMNSRVVLGLGIVAACIAVAALLGGSATISDWYSMAAGALSETLGAAGSDFAAAGREGAAALGAVMRSLEQYRSPLSSVWLLLSAAMATALMVAFNYTQARAQSRRK